jgi:hypothetical protein
VEIPGFALAGGGIRGDRIQMARGGHTVLEIQYSGRALPIDVSAPGLQTTVVPITRDRARLLLVDDGASDETQLTLAVGDRDILDVPVDIVDTHSVAPPVDRVNFELGLGSAIIGPIQIAGTTAESGGIVSSVRYTARILASEWFSAGLVGDVGPLLGADPVLFMPGVGFEGVVHAPWERFRPFVSAGFESWFPGLDRAWPALEGSVGVDWEPDEGAGVRAAARAVVLTDQGEPMVVPGGFLGVFTSFR